MILNRFARQSLNSKVLNAMTQMRRYTTPLNDMEFLINEVFKFPDRYKELGYDVNLVNKETIGAVLTETAKFAETELAPLNSISDIHGHFHFFLFSLFFLLSSL